MNHYRKRDKLKVIYDMLQTIHERNDKIKPTHLMYKANLSHKMMQDYLKELIMRGFVTENKSKKEVYYHITKRGLDYLNKYHSIVNFVESFGLEEND